MGLDITAYQRLKEVRPLANVDDDGYRDGLVAFRPNEDFVGRFDGLKEKVLYRPTESFGFRAGSYSGYNAWREWLAGLVAYPPTPHVGYAGHVEQKRAAACWNGATGPFAELINFSDCEGAIGPKVSAKLAKDFAEWDDRAKAADPEGWNYQRYQHWHKAFAMAADSGAVDFH